MSESKIAVKKQRNYGIDLLRIVAISMVLVLHVLGKDNILSTTEKLSANFNAAWLLEIAAYCAVDCYALISGYVGFQGKHKASNIVMLWLQVAFYSIGATLLFKLILPESVNNLTLFNSFFPVMTKQYWYFTSYFGLFLITPLLNAAVNSMTKKQLEGVLIAIFIFVSVISVSFFNDVFLFNNGYSMFWLAVMYLFGAYFGKYNTLEKTSKLKLFIIYLACVLITWVTKLLMVYLTDELAVKVFNKNLLVSYMSPTIVTAAICLLGIFANLNISEKIGKIIVYVASLSFGVYLIQSQPLISRQFMRDSFAKFSNYPTLGLVFAVLGTAALIFVVCAAIDAVRQLLFKAIRVKKLVVFAESRVLSKFKSKES